MNLVLTLLVKNEADVIDANIRYHLSSGVSHIIATDNGSDDGTREILEEYANDGVLTLIDEPGKDYSQWKWVTRMAALARDRLKATGLSTAMPMNSGGIPSMTSPKHCPVPGLMCSTANATISYSQPQIARKSPGLNGLSIGPIIERG